MHTPPAHQCQRYDKLQVSLSLITWRMNGGFRAGFSTCYDGILRLHSTGMHFVCFMPTSVAWPKVRPVRLLCHRLAHFAAAMTPVGRPRTLGAIALARSEETRAVRSWRQAPPLSSYARHFCRCRLAAVSPPPVWAAKGGTDE